MSRSRIFNKTIVFESANTPNREERRHKSRISTLFTKKKTRGRTQYTGPHNGEIVTRPSLNLLRFFQYSLLVDAFDR